MTGEYREILLPVHWRYCAQRLNSPSMENFYLYMFIASMTIMTPGPGVLLTLTNTLNFDLVKAIPGILGVSAGMAIISVIAASSVGMIIASSNLAMTIVKILGAMYLSYLAYKLFNSTSVKTLSRSDDHAVIECPSTISRFREGLMISLLNPKPIVFFMALFPQFINPEKSFAPQFVALSVVFCILVVIIHFGYGFFAETARRKLAANNVFNVLNKVSGAVFCFFAVGLVWSTLIQQ